MDSVEGTLETGSCLLDGGLHLTRKSQRTFFGSEACDGAVYFIQLLQKFIVHVIDAGV